MENDANKPREIAIPWIKKSGIIIDKPWITKKKLGITIDKPWIIKKKSRITISYR